MPHALLADKIRFASEPDNPSIIREWLSYPSETFDQAQLRTPTAESSDMAWFDYQRSVYQAQFRLLLDTVIDELIPSHWRECCLDHIYLPLAKLEKIATSTAHRTLINQMYYELQILTKHAEATFYSNYTVANSANYIPTYTVTTGVDSNTADAAATTSKVTPTAASLATTGVKS